MDRHDGTSSSDSDASQSATTKQMAACKTCKAKHRRCDGLAPCSTCIKHGIECDPSQTLSRKGPTRGELKELRESVNQLQQEVEAQRRKYKDLREKYELLVLKKAESEDISLSGHLTSIHVLHVTLQRYNDHALPWYHVSMPYNDFQFIREKKGMNSQVLCAYACLLSGSLLSGDQAQSAELFKYVSDGLRGMYDKIDPYICASYMMLSRAYMVFTDNDKAAMCNATALHMSEMLMSKLNTREVCGVNLETVKQNCLMNCMSGDKEAQIRRIKESLDKTLQDSKGVPMQAIFMMRQIWMMISIAMRSNDKSFNSDENIKYIIALISIVKQLVDKSELPFRDTSMIRLLLTVAIMTFLIGMDRATNLIVDRMLEKTEQVCKELHHTQFLLVMPLFMIGQVLMYKGEQATVERIIRTTKRLTPISVYATVVSDSLSGAEFDRHDIPNRYETIFYQYIHRFRQTNLTYGNTVSQTRENDLLSVFEDVLALTPYDVSVTKKSRVDERRSVVRASESLTPLHTRVRPSVDPVSVPGHVAPAAQSQYHYIQPEVFLNYYNHPLSFNQPQRANNYAIQTAPHTLSQVPGSDLNLQLDYEEVVQTTSHPYQLLRSENGSHSYFQSNNI